MDSTSTASMPYLTRIDIINQLNQEQHQCLLTPNPYANVSAQVWANPATQEAKLVIDGKPLSKTMQTQLIQALQSHQLTWLLATHKDTTDPAGKVADMIEDGHEAFDKRYEIKTGTDSLTLFKKDGDRLYKQAKLSKNYRNNGPAITQPNPYSPHAPGTKKYRPTTERITPGQSQAIWKTNNLINGLGGRAVKWGGKGLGIYGDAMDMAEVSQDIANKDYNAAKKKVSGMAGGKIGARAGASVGAEIGMALPIPHPLFKAGAVVVCALLGAAGGAFGGEATGEWLYSVSDKIKSFTGEEAAPAFDAFPTDINSNLSNVHLSSQRLYNSNQDIIGYTKRPDGALTPIRRSDLGDY